MRAPWRAWDAETFACAVRGHCIPAADVEQLAPDERDLGVDTDDGRRFARCLRCDAWIDASATATSRPALPPRSELPTPRRGKALRDAIVLRIIAVDRGLHAIAFTLLAVALLILTLRLPSLQSFARSLNHNIATITENTGRNPSRGFLLRQLHRVLDLDPKSVHVLLFTATAYAVVEGVEAVGLWLERRWAEYLTALATAGFLPFEIHELLNRVTVVRIGALVVNVAVLVWLVYSKHLFGLRGGQCQELREEQQAD